MDRQQFLFAYGTLRKDYRPYPVIGIEEKLKFIGVAGIKGILFDLGCYPGAVENKNGGTIRGDLFLLKDPVKTLGTLDDYEGCSGEEDVDDEFIRREINVRLEDGNTAAAWIYWFNRQTDDKTVITQGDYLLYLQNKQSGSY
ncbi:MAG TPA: gamma-glutamylcyclotransferase family protein [Puia sp.]|nr:gamma-glutamylcyclotransferase family protein [Puia sp.]